MSREIGRKAVRALGTSVSESLTCLASPNPIGPCRSLTASLPPLTQEPLGGSANGWCRRAAELQEGPLIDDVPECFRYFHVVEYRDCRLKGFVSQDVLHGRRGVVLLSFRGVPP